MNYQEFHRWATRFGPFDVDACCDPLGKNKLVSTAWWSKENSCLDNDWAGKRVWCNPPYTANAELVQQISSDLHLKGYVFGMIAQMGTWTGDLWTLIMVSHLLPLAPSTCCPHTCCCSTHTPAWHAKYT